MIRKDAAGASNCSQGDDEPLIAAVVRELFDHPLAAGAITEALSGDVPRDSEAIVIVEGETDVAYLRRAAELHGRADRLARLHFDPAHGAVQAALRTLICKGRCDVPAIALLDHDEMGLQARNLLTKQQIPKREVITYRLGREVDDAEAEHLFADALFDEFLARHGESALKSKVRHKDGWAFDLRPAFKEQFAKFVAQNATAADTQRFVPVVDRLLELAGV